MAIDYSAFDPGDPAEERKASIRRAMEGYLAKPPKPSLFPQREPGKPRAAKPKRNFSNAAWKWLNGRGYNVVRADSYDARFNRAHDLLGFLDFIGFGDMETVGVQVTSKDQISARRKKILESPRLKWLERAGWKVLLLGFGDQGEVIEEWLL